MVLGVTPYHCDDCGLSHVKSLRFSCSGSHFHHLFTSPFPPLPHLSTSTAPQPIHFHRISAFLPPLHLPLSITSIHLHLAPRFVAFSTAHFYHPLCLFASLSHPPSVTFPTPHISTSTFLFFLLPSYRQFAAAFHATPASLYSRYDNPVASALCAMAPRDTVICATVVPLPFLFSALRQSCCLCTLRYGYRPL